MRKEIADKLVSALRSGEYSQTTGRLRDGDSYCCLGVLCDIAVKEGVIQPWELVKVSYGYRYGFNVPVVESEGETYNESSVLPYEVRIWAGMKHANGSYDNVYSSETESLSSDNDNGASFYEISYTIERLYDEL